MTALPFRVCHLEAGVMPVPGVTSVLMLYKGFSLSRPAKIPAERARGL
ncbi:MULTISPECIES: hypothetical protein [unclassified Streptomyces]